MCIFVFALQRHGVGGYGLVVKKTFLASLVMVVVGCCVNRVSYTRRFHANVGTT